MKTTNKEHIIKDKLERVDLPDMNASWQKMEQSIEAAVPVQGGWSAFLAKYKIYLNLFVAGITIGVVGLYVKSKTHTSNNVYTPTEVAPVHQTTYLSFNTQIDHNNDLPVPASPVIKGTEIETNSETLPAIQEREVAVLDTIKPAPKVEKPTKPVVNYLDTTDDELDFEQVDLRRDIERQFHYVRNQVGIKIQTGVFPNNSGQGVMQTTGFGLFGRRFITDRTAIHVELGYNPIAIRPITYVENYNVFNNFNYTQTDSAIVTGLKYVTIPVNLYAQLMPNVSISGGPQVSFLTGLSGELTRKYDYPNAPETAMVTEKTSISNRGGFNKTDFGINLEFTVHTGRLETGVRLQQGFGDYSTNKLSRQKHSISTAQLKVSWILNE